MQSTVYRLSELPKHLHQYFKPAKGLEIGSEETPAAYIDKLVRVFREVRRVLRDDGVVWLNLGDSYARDAGKGGSGTPNGRNGRGERYRGAGLGACKPKDLIGIPWLTAFALRDDGWYLRSEVIWSKPNAMPESVTDRPTKAHEQIFLLTKNERYYYDAAAIAEKATATDGGLQRQHWNKIRSGRE